MVRKRYTEIAVGLFIIASIVAFTMLALQVSGLNTFHESNDTYKVTMEFTNVGNLKKRGKVTIAGVTVGRVIDIVLAAETYNAMVLIAMDKGYNIPDDTTASILTAGLLGDNYVGLTPGFSDDFLQEGSVIVMENTHSALVLEQLIDKFITNQSR
ncbi:MAG: outer membrane lipid asymmetry maintenance protein MlaD [Thiotrichales bacterium]|nr:MAG: outer membrane lipid asymmetry maintenance protein MlaD [Thiotrichales bacterium]